MPGGPPNSSIRRAWMVSASSVLRNRIERGSFGKAFAQLAVVLDGCFEVFEHLGTHPAPAHVVTHRLGQQPGDVLVGLAREFLERPLLLFFDLGTDLDAGHRPSMP